MSFICVLNDQLIGKWLSNWTVYFIYIIIRTYPTRCWLYFVTFWATLYLELPNNEKGRACFVQLMKFLLTLDERGLIAGRVWRFCITPDVGCSRRLLRRVAVFCDVTPFILVDLYGLLEEPAALPETKLGKNGHYSSSVALCNDPLSKVPFYVQPTFTSWPG